MRRFLWFGAEKIPRACDLRRRGWTLCTMACDRFDADAVALAFPAAMDPQGWAGLRRISRGRVLVLGIGRAGERARLLRLGFGEAVGPTSLCEVEARAIRVAARAGMIDTQRKIGPLRLDLFARDGFVDGRRLALHPREFALLWRLAETPGRPVGRPVLLREVWRLGHQPETNSLAVHVCRLRARLAARGLGDLLLTAPAGGYMLAPPDPPALPPLTRDSCLDDLIAAE